MRPSNKKIEGVGEKIREAREEWGVSLEDLAKAMGISQTKIWGWEKEDRYPSMLDLGKIAVFLAKPIEYFLP